jgi:hypothetical protein
MVRTVRSGEHQQWQGLRTDTVLRYGCILTVAVCYSNCLRSSSLHWSPDSCCLRSSSLESLSQVFFAGLVPRQTRPAVVALVARFKRGQQIAAAIWHTSGGVMVSLTLFVLHATAAKYAAAYCMPLPRRSLPVPRSTLERPAAMSLHTWPSFLARFRSHLVGVDVLQVLELNQAFLKHLHAQYGLVATVRHQMACLVHTSWTAFAANHAWLDGIISSSSSLQHQFGFVSGL